MNQPAPENNLGSLDDDYINLDLNVVCSMIDVSSRDGRPHLKVDIFWNNF